MTVFFNGRLIVSPSTVSVVDDSAMANNNASTGNVLALIGKSLGGVPNTALRFGSPSEALAVLGDCEASKLIAKAFDPSPEVPGPSQVVFIRVNPATQAALALKDATSATVIDLVSTNYGRIANQIKVKIEAGSTKGKKVTVESGNDYYAADNLYRDAFSLQYAGSATAVTVAVANAALTLSVDGTPTVIDLNDYPTVGQLVDRINAVTGFSASVIDGNSDKPTLQGLDSLAATDCKTAAVTVTGNLQAVIDWLNSAGEGFVTATRHAGAGAAPANIPFTYLAGASDGTTTNTNWQNAFDVLQTVDAQWIVPLSADPAIHAMADTHVAYMSTVARKERRALVGGANAVTDDAAILAAKAINSDRTAYTHLGFYDYNSDGVLTLYPAYGLAVMIAAGFAGSNPGTPMTNKALKVQGLERVLRNPTDTDRLILGGVLCVESTETGYKVVKSISTWLVNSNFNRVEISCGAATDYVARQVRAALDPLRGKKLGPQLLQQAISNTESALSLLAKPEPLGVGVLVGDKTSPAFRGIAASINGDALQVEFQCSPVIPSNYITITIHAVPYTGQATA